MRVIVVGGGASGMMAAIYAAKQKNQVVLLEKNKGLGKKLLLTGNGKCNYWNQDQSFSHYHSSDLTQIPDIMNGDNQNEIMSFFESLGILPKIKNGYYYPMSNQASSIQTALIKELRLSGVQLELETEVISVQKNKKFIVKTNQGDYEADCVIIATGSLAAPKTGSDGKGYQIATNFGHSVIKPLPALTGIIGNQNYYKEWNGVRSDVLLSLYVDGKMIHEENGEIQLTNYGISGICVFQISGQVARNLNDHKKQKIEICFLPFLKEKFLPWMEKRNQMVHNRTISELLDGILNYKIVNLLLKLSGINREMKWNQLTEIQKKQLEQNIMRFLFVPVATNSYDQAQTCTGGIPLREIHLNTMESLKQQGLYFTGEVLDVNGDCGGYNLGFAWITGMIAGKMVGKN